MKQTDEVEKILKNAKERLQDIRHEKNVVIEDLLNKTDKRKIIKIRNEIKEL